MTTDRASDRKPPRDDAASDRRDTDWKRRFRRALLHWFARSARDMPWRPSPGLYETWVSEVMLQQTQIATVIPYYRRFIDRFPDVETLADADEQEVLRHWEGLGYYRRARQLHAAARQVVSQFDGHVPVTLEQLQTLPGIGRYTAGAILSIALDQRHPILEANTTRVLSRILALEGDPTGTEQRRRLWAFAELILPRRHVGDFNQALMELGSTLCTPRRPDCPQCPVPALCAARKLGVERQIPAVRAKPIPQTTREAAVVVRHNGRLLVRQCSPAERWAGLWDFPRFAIRASRGPAFDQELVAHVARITGVTIVPGRRIATIKHTVTRYRITLVCHEATCRARAAQPPHANQRWVRVEELAVLPLSVTGRKISRMLTDSTHA
jgi:A/G-specific adenine glycosylase